MFYAWTVEYTSKAMQLFIYVVYNISKKSIIESIVREESPYKFMRIEFSNTYKNLLSVSLYKRQQTHKGKSSKLSYI